MLDVCLLGTGGMMPLPNRYLTSLLVRYNGHSILIDCGEGTQIALRAKGWSANPIDVMCFTHFHADHISGLPGMLLTMGNTERTKPLLIVGPKGVAQVVNSLRVVARDLPFDIHFVELGGKDDIIEQQGYFIKAFRVNHNIPCYGYSIQVPRKGKFDVDRARQQNIPVEYWNPLQRGEEPVTPEGRRLTPDMVLGPDRKGLKITYTTDTRPTAAIGENAAGADIFVCEGMYGEKDKLSKARENKHMTMHEAAELAAGADVGELWLTHFSPSLANPKQYLKEVRDIFPRSYIYKDGKSLDLKFED